MAGKHVRQRACPHCEENDRTKVCLHLIDCGATLCHGK